MPSQFRSLLRASFANRLGEAIRDEAPIRKEGWKFVPEGIKKLVIKRVQVISF